MINASSTLTDVAFAVCTALDRVGKVAVLTGGSAATYYAPDAYQSGDLDFVITMGQSDAGGEQALANLGYQRHGDFYVHPGSAFPLEFPPGPLQVGNDLVAAWNTDTRGGELLHVLSPTDSCRDRLAAFLFWNDFSGLEQCLAVCRAHWKDIDSNIVRRWCEREGHAGKHDLFEERLRRLGLVLTSADYQRIA